MVNAERKDLILYATMDSSPATDGKGVNCGGVPNDESTLLASGKDKPYGSMHQNFVGKFSVGFPQNEFRSLPMYNAASTNKLTPKASNNFKSKDLDANSLLFEHVDIQKDTTKDTFINLLVSEDDDTYPGSDVIAVIQPEVLVQYVRDVISNLVGSLACLIFHFDVPIKSQCVGASLVGRGMISFIFLSSFLGVNTVERHTAFSLSFSLQPIQDEILITSLMTQCCLQKGLTCMNIKTFSKKILQFYNT